MLPFHINYRIIAFIVLFICISQAQNYTLSFSTQRGFYQESFVLSISSFSSESILYTIDGSDPRFSSTVTISNSPATIEIDPENSSGRDIAPGYIVRACVVADSVPPPYVYTHTYLFLNHLTNLSPDGQRPGTKWPLPNSSDGSRQYMDYGLDPDVYNDPRYSNKIEEAFLAIPTISLATDLENLFDPDYGIYVNAFFHGEEWERPGSVELLNPDSKPGFQVNCGIRIRGGWSRHNENPKHAFRLFFREEYGASELTYHLYGADGVNEFDKVDLRTSQNYSWSYYGDSQNTFLRDVFSRDIQREMGDPYTRSRYYHLYLNGTYWGLFQTQERPEASFAQAYFGGDRDDYDVVKINTGTYFDVYEVEATDGTLDAYQRLWEACNSGFASLESYYRIQGLNPDGSRNPDYEALVDVDNLINYMLCTFYVGDFDAPVTNFRGNVDPNNYYGIYNRVNPEGFKFFRHDAEHTLFDNPWGLDRTGPFPAGEYFEKFNPQWLHQKLIENPVYRMRFADLVYKYFFHDGILTPQASINRILSRKKQINLAIIAESARWGDAKVHPPRTKDDDWLAEINFIVSDYLLDRSDVVLNQLKNKGWYPNINPPYFNLQDGLINQGTSLTISAELGTIYYTTDGSDPFQADTSVQNNTLTLIAKNSEKRVFIPSADIGDSWGNDVNFDDSAWLICNGTQGGIGYENDSGYEQYIDLDVTDIMYNINTSCYIRTTFNLSSEDLAEITSLTLKMYYDDGFIAYLNGSKVMEYNAPATPQWNSQANANHEATNTAENFNLSTAINTLVIGQNLLAIQGLNVSSTSSDFLILPELVAGNSSFPGNISPTAIEYTDPIIINTTTHVKTRAFDGFEWSAQNEISLWVEDSYNTLKVTEIHYHPLGEGDILDSEFEFLELKNIGSASIILDNAYFSRGINYTFPFNTVLNSGDFIVLVSNYSAFNSRYQMTPFGEYLGQLDNNGETISLHSSGGDTIINLKYNDVYPWPASPDGVGYSLVPKNINQMEDQNNPDNWRPSRGVHGSPGADTSTYSEPPVSHIQDDLPSIPLKFRLYQNYPNPFNVQTNIRFDIEKTAKVSLKIYNILGQEVATLIYKTLQSGKYTAHWDASKYASGIYFYRLITKEFCQTKKIILLK
jgi:hypothetical protein